MEEFEQLVEIELQSSEVNHLQSLLEKRWMIKDNYIEEWWENLGYLRSREALPAVEAFCVQLEPDQCSQASRAAQVILGTTSFVNRIITSKMPVNGSTRREPFSMVQYMKAFASCRIPGLVQDTRDFHLKRLDEMDSALVSKNKIHGHVVLLVKGQFFQVDLDVPVSPGAEFYRRPTLGELHAQVLRILNQVGSEKKRLAQPPVGWFTSMTRSRWAKIRQEMINAGNINRSSLAKIETAQAVISLDPSAPNSLDAQMDQLGCGDHGEARFYDHTLNWVVFKNGKCGLTFEHSGLDAAVYTMLMEDTFEEVKDVPTAPELELSVPPPQILEFSLPNHLFQSLSEWPREFREWKKTYWDVRTTRTEAAGKTLLKSLCVSPDGFLQICFQLAYFRLTQKLPSTYESVATLRFFNGRTEAGRSVTSASKRFVEAFSNDLLPKPSTDLLRSAIQESVEFCKAASKGQGVDRHMFALRAIANEQGLPVPSFLSHPLLLRASKWDLSTSHVLAPKSGKYASSAVFHPVALDSVGVVYSIFDSTVDLTVITSRQWKGVESVEFVEMILRVMNELVFFLRGSPL